MPDFLLLDGRTLHFETFGQGQGQSRNTPALLLHGYLDSHKSFFRLFEGLGADRMLIALDQRGHGDSSPAKDYSIAHFTDDAIALLDHLALGPVHILGHSLGGIVAQRIAQERPELVQSLALIGTASSAAGNAALSWAAPLLADLTDSVPAALAVDFQASITHAPLPEDVFAVFLAETAKVSLAAWRGTLDGLLLEPAPEKTRIRQPVLIIWGENDPIFITADQDQLRAALPQAYFLALPATGHAPHWERPEHCITALAGFWRRKQ